MRHGPITRDASTVQLGLSQIRIGVAAANIATVTPVLTAADSIGAVASTNFTSETTYFDLESGFPLQLDATFPMKEMNMLECAFKEITPKSLALARGLDPFANLNATAEILSSVTVAGTYVAGGITADNTGGVVNDTFVIVLTDASNYKVYGIKSGYIGTSLISASFAPANSGHPYFTIQANFLTGTWAAGQTLTFATTKYVAGTSAFASAHVGAIPLGTLAAPKFLRVEAVYTFPDPQYSMVILFPRANVTSSLKLDQQPSDVAAVTMSIKSMGASSDTTGGDAAWDSMPNGQILFLTA